MKKLIQIDFIELIIIISENENEQIVLISDDSLKHLYFVILFEIKTEWMHLISLVNVKDLDGAINARTYQVWPLDAICHHGSK